MLVDNIVTPEFLGRNRGGRPLRVLDPACGDGRFLEAVATRAGELGVRCALTGVDVDPAAIDGARLVVPCAHLVVADALVNDFGGARFDLVIGNPPFLSQMAAATTRGGATRRSGGPYADAAVEFLHLAGELVDPSGGRVLFVLPQSILSTRDAGEVRRTIDQRARLVWSWWTGERVFDAQVLTCALGFEFDPNRSSDRAANDTWAHVVTSRQGIPPLGPLAVNGRRLSDVARLNANFRDEYYGMVPAVGDHDSGPALITSGLIDPGRTLWGTRPITFAKQRFLAPRLDLDLLDDRMRAWAQRRLVPKVLLANQTSILEAVCDERGEWLPAVPVVAVYPFEAAESDPSAWEIAALLTSPVASAWCWHATAGTGLSANAIRIGPVVLGGLPLPHGSLSAAADALRSGDVRLCGDRVMDAYGVEVAGRELLISWWGAALERIERRSA
jgi:SAM-dependent methyltransferase